MVYWTCVLLFRPVGVLSEEQIRLKKQKKQQEDETARSSTEVPATTPPQEAATLDPQQHEMIEKLVAMQKQCNKRSFLERPKVTVSRFALEEDIVCLFTNLNWRLCVCARPEAVASESRPAEPRGASAALRPLHRAGHHVSPGDSGLCQTASGILGAHQGRPDRPAEDVNH